MTDSSHSDSSPPDSSQPDQEQNTVSHWISGLKQGDADAARLLWDRYCRALVRAARKRLGDAPRAAADEEDVALSAFATLCRRAADGQFGELTNRHDLWWLLLSIMRRKAIDQIRRETTDKRGGLDVTVSIQDTEKDGGSEPHGIQFTELISDEPTPEYLAALAEEYDRLLGLLRDEGVRGVAVLRVEGYSVEEIAARLGISARSVERKLELIRTTWSREMGH